MTPKVVSVGPTARMRSFSEPVPLTTKPGINTLSPVPTKARVEALITLTVEEVAAS